MEANMNRAKRFLFLAAAIAFLSPVARSATVVFSYDPTVHFYKDATLTISDGTGQIVANAVAVPSGDYFTIGANVSVSGNTNPAGPAGTSPQNIYSNVGGAQLQPTNLGFGSFFLQIADDNPAFISPLGRNGTTNPSQFSTASIDPNVYNAGTSPAYIQPNGTVGADPSGNPFAGVINTVFADPTTATGKSLITEGVDSPVALFTNLAYKAGFGLGGALLMPTLDLKDSSIARYALGGTDTGTPPQYANRFLTAGDNVTVLPALTVNVSEHVPEPGSVTALLLSAWSVLIVRRRRVS
jgi:hypothetical protein